MPSGLSNLTCDIPVKHLITKNAISHSEVNDINQELLKTPTCTWTTYFNDNEQKKTCNDVSMFGPLLRRLVDQFQCRSYCSILEKTFDIKPLQSDPLFHGGGVHISGPGGKLSVHLDYARHPRLPLLERRLNAILCLSPEWREEWGGATIFTAPDGVTVLGRVYPKPGQLLLFETSDLSYHGVEPVTCPEGVERITLATYYLSVCRENVTRERALFIPQR